MAFIFLAASHKQLLSLKTKLYICLSKFWAYH